MSTPAPETVIPVGVEARGNEQLWFAPAIANTNAPTVSEAEFPILCSMTTAFGATGEQATTERWRACSAQAMTALGAVSINVDALEYVYDPQEPESDNYQAYAELTEGRTGYLIDRRGKASGEPLAAGDVVDVYPVRLGFRNRVTNPVGEDVEFRVSQAVGVTGRVIQDAVIAA